jgi:lauroyl/myristoyl acyltransferase
VAARRRLDAPTGWLARLAVPWPRLALTLASALGSARHRLTRRWPSAHEVAELFPRLSPVDATRVASSIGALAERNEVLARSAKKYGIASLRPLALVPGALRRLEGPCILATFHLGAVHMLGAALETLGRPVLVFRQGRLFTPRPPVELASTKGTDQVRAAAFVRAAGFLRRGGLVMLALDAPPGAAIEVPCLGRRLRLARGAFALARLGGVPIVPVVARWRRGGSVEVLVDAPLRADTGQESSAAFELELAQAAGRWLEAYALANPAEVTLGLLRELLYGVTPEDSES